MNGLIQDAFNGIYPCQVTSSCAYTRNGVALGRCTLTDFLPIDEEPSRVDQWWVNSDKSVTKSERVGRFLRVLDLKMSCRLVRGGPRQFVGARTYLNQWGIAMRVTWASVFSTTWPRFSQSSRHLDLDDSVPSLNAVSHDKKSASVQQADVQTNFSPAKNLQLCDKKSASVRRPLHMHLLIRCRSRLWGTTQESWHCKCGTRISWLPCFTHERTLSCRAGKVLGVHHEQNKVF